jgi:hypothetical protein
MKGAAVITSLALMASVGGGTAAAAAPHHLDRHQSVAVSSAGRVSEAFQAAHPELRSVPEPRLVKLGDGRGVAERHHTTTHKRFEMRPMLNNTSWTFYGWQSGGSAYRWAVFYDYNDGAYDYLYRLFSANEQTGYNYYYEYFGSFQLWYGPVTWDGIG